MNRYIALSMVIHLLFFGYLGLTHSIENEPTVFDVHIVNPADMSPAPEIAEKEVTPKKQALEKAPVPVRKPVIIKRRRRPVNPDNSVKPDVVFGEGAGQKQKDVKGSESSGDSAKRERMDSEKPEQEAVLSGPDVTEPSDLAQPSKPAVDFLFDKKTIEKYASKGSPEGAGVEDGKGLMFYAPEFKNRAYMRMLRDRIESIWKYPKEAARRRLTGDLYIKFSIRKNGKLESVELVRTSGYRELDEAAVQALKKGDPYWPLPENFDKELLEITGHFIYVLGGSYVM